MTPRVPESPLLRRLSRLHRAVRRALVLRHAVRGAAAICATLAMAIALGVAFTLGPDAAWVTADRRNALSHGAPG